MKALVSLLLTTLFLSSCATNSEKTIAINILFTPSEQLYEHSIYLNNLMSQNNPETMILGEDRIPHITLLQVYIKESDLPKIKKALTGLHSSIASKDFYAESLVFSTDKSKSFAMIRIEKSSSLLAIHELAIALVQNYAVPNGSQESFVSNADGTAIDQFTIDYVPQFIEEYSHEKFDPHLSLGVAKTSFLDSLANHVFKPMPFKATSISVYQMGEYGTAQKLLWHSDKT